MFLFSKELVYLCLQISNKSVVAKAMTDARRLCYYYFFRYRFHKYGPAAHSSKSDERCIKMYNKIKKITLGIACVFFWQSQAIIVGSFTNPSRQAAIVFPPNDPTNEMRGFAAFENGFALANGTVNCLFNAYFPVAGNIDLRGGVLNLRTDLHVSDVATFVSTGTIRCNSRSVTLPSSIPPVTFAGSTSLQLITSVDVGGGINSFDWSVGDQYIAVSRDKTVADTEMFIYSFNGVALSQVSTRTGTVSSGEAVGWHPTLNYVALGINEDVNGPDLYVYQFAPGPNTLTETGNGLMQGAVYAVAWNPRGNWLASSSSSPTQQVRIFTFNSGTGSITQFATDTLVPNRLVQNNAMSWDSSGHYLVFGVANDATVGANELIVDYFDDVTISATVGVDIGQTVTTVDWSPTGTFIAVGLGGSTERLRIYQHNISNGTLTESTSARVGETSTVNSVDWHPSGNYLAAGVASGTGTEIRIYNFDKTAVMLSIFAQLNWESSIKQIRWSRSGNFLATIDSANVLSIFAFGGAPFAFDTGTLIFNSDINMATQFLATGTCVIEGNNYTLDLSNTDSFTIGSGATVLMKNMVIKGIIDGKINFIDTTGVLQLRDVIWTQTGDYTFTKGAFTIDGTVLFTGTSTFIYSSSKTSTINANATMMFDNNMTFSYVPSTANNSLLAMTDNTSNLYLLNTTLFANTIGLKLTKGNLILDGLCPIVSLATAAAQGILLGDGVSAINNVGINVLAESGFNINSGFLVYQNV